MTGIPSRPQWESTTSDYYTAVYNDNERSSGVTNAEVEISITDVSVLTNSDGKRQRRRTLNSADNTTMTSRALADDVSVRVTYTQTMWYDIIISSSSSNSSSKGNSSSGRRHRREEEEEVDSTTTGNADTIFQFPLSTESYRDEYIGRLKHTLTGYEDLTAVSEIVMVREKEEEEGGGGKGGNLSTGAIAAMAAGGAALLAILAIIVHYHCKECQNIEDEYEFDGGEDSDPDGREGARTTPTPALYGGQPHLRTTGDRTMDGASTVDYDYQRAYGGGAGGVCGLSLISDAGGTLGSRSRRTGADQDDDPTTMGDRTIYSNDPTYAQPMMYDDDDDDDVGREEMLEVYAPAGKLGVVIDNPDGVTPTIHAVKDTSPIASQVCAGDRVVAVDDEDVRGMSAMKVSRLISRKSGNVSRKLTIIRVVR